MLESGEPSIRRCADRHGSDIVRRVLALHRAREIEGLTFSGGEPMQQASSVLELIERLRGDGRDAAIDLWNVHGIYSGELDQGRYFTFNECPEKTTMWKRFVIASTSR